MAKYLGLRCEKLSKVVGFISMLAILSFGYNQTVAGGLLTTDSFNRQFPTINTVDTTGAQKHHNSTIQGRLLRDRPHSIQPDRRCHVGTIIALYTAAGTLGALSCTFFGDYFGRRKIIFGATALQATGAILMGTSFSLAQFIVARVILGLGSGGVTATVSAWQTDLSKAHSRGSHVSAFGIFCGMGLALGLWVDMGFSYVKSSASWRFPFLFQLIFSAFVLSFIFLLPESPRWLVKMDRVQEARDILTLVYFDSDASAVSANEAAEREISEIQHSMTSDSSMRQLISMGPKRILHRVILGMVIQMFFQITGISAVTAYASTIYESHLNFSPLASKALAASSQILIILGSCVCSWTVDRFGRRTLMLISASGMAACLAALSGLMSDPENKSALKAAVFFLYLYFSVYTIGFLGIPFLYASEIAPSHLRAATCGLSTASSWLFNFVVAEVTPVALADIGWRYFIVFAVLNACMVPAVYFFFPETAGRQLEEIDEIFIQSKSIWEPVKVARKLGLRQSVERLGQGEDSPVEKSVSGRVEKLETEAVG